jgi:hypothetical protein
VNLRVRPRVVVTLESSLFHATSDCHRSFHQGECRSCRVARDRQACVCRGMRARVRLEKPHRTFFTCQNKHRLKLLDYAYTNSNQKLVTRFLVDDLSHALTIGCTWNRSRLGVSSIVTARAPAWPARGKFFAFPSWRHPLLGSWYRNHTHNWSHVGNTDLTEFYHHLKLVSGLHEVGALIKSRFLPVQGVCLAELGPTGISPQLVRSGNPRKTKADRVQEQTSKSNTAQRTHRRRHTF